MKQVYFIIAMLCGLALGGQAQGIRFAEGSWKELLETAKKEGKLIFVDCYTEWCQPCKQMEQQVFPSKKVGKFYRGTGDFEYLYNQCLPDPFVCQWRRW